MGLCIEHRKDEYHDDEDCVVCLKDRAWECCQARKEQLISRNKQLQARIDKLEKEGERCLLK